MFVYGEDWIKTQMYEKLMYEATNQCDADIVKCGFVYTNGKNKNTDFAYRKGVQVFSENDVDQFFHHDMYAIIWNAVYKSEIAKKDLVV